MEQDWERRLDRPGSSRGLLAQAPDSKAPSPTRLLPTLPPEPTVYLTAAHSRQGQVHGHMGIAWNANADRVVPWMGGLEL